MPPSLACSFISYYPDRGGDSVSVCVSQKAQRRRSGSQPVAMAASPTATAPPPPPKITEFVASLHGQRRCFLIHCSFACSFARVPYVIRGTNHPQMTFAQFLYCTPTHLLALPNSRILPQICFRPETPHSVRTSFMHGPLWCIPTLRSIARS